MSWSVCVCSGGGGSFHFHSFIDGCIMVITIITSGMIEFTCPTEHVKCQMLYSVSMYECVCVCGILVWHVHTSNNYLLQLLWYMLHHHFDILYQPIWEVRMITLILPNGLMCKWNNLRNIDDPAYLFVGWMYTVHHLLPNFLDIDIHVLIIINENFGINQQ